MINNFCNNINPSVLVGKYIIPNQKASLSNEEFEKRKKEAENMLGAFKGESFTTTTQDNVNVKVMFFSGFDPKTQTLPKTAPTVIIFCGLGGYAHHYGDLIKKYQERGCNVAIFNYRGIENDCQPNPEGMIQDGISVVDHIHHHHGVPLNNIFVHGNSLGGGPSSAVAAQRPGVGVVNDRSYSSLSQCSSNFIKVAMQNHPIIGKVSGVSKIVLKGTGWEFDTAQNWTKIKGKKCVVYHPNDEVIGDENGLYKALLGKNSDTTFIELNPNISGSPHGRAFENVEMDAIVNTMVPKVNEIAINIIQQNEVIRPISKSLKDRIKQLFIDIFYIIIYPLGLYQIFRNLCKCS